MKLQDYHQIQRNYQASGALLEVGQRIAMLESLEKGLKKYEKDLEQALYQDLGKSVPEVHFSELQAVYGEIRLFRRKIKKWSGFRRKKAGITNFPSRAYVHRSPYGCVLIIAPWNYPYRLSLSPLVGAIAGGNSVMMKLSERIHASTALLEKILAESLPKEVLHMIPADAPPEQIWSVPYDMVFFTGSVKTGRTIAKECGDRMIPCVLELGGKSPVVLLDDADVGLAAKRILWGKGFNAGQTCIAPDHVYLKKDQLEPFVSAFKDYHKKYYPQGMDTEYYPKLVDDKHFDQLFALREGGRVVYGGDYRREDLKMDLTLITDVVENSPLDKEEIFGPILPLYLYEDEEALKQKLWSMEPPPSLLHLYEK